jgi:hypothetical protein
MIKDGSKTFTLREYRGCGIQPASVRLSPTGWLPEACFWVYTEQGWRRLWVASFAHCLPRTEMTFPSQTEADGWAFHLARGLIDRIMTDSSAYNEVSRARMRLFAKLIG